MRTENDPPARSAERTMKVLEFLARRTYPTPTMVIAQECDIPKSSLHNLLNTMRTRRFVTYHSDSRGWSLGSRLFEIAGDAPLLTHALAVFRAFGQGTQLLDVGEVTRLSELPPMVVTRLLPVLEQNDLLAKTPGGRYRLGAQLVALASRVSDLDQLRIVTRPILTRLRDATRETANLVVLESDHAVYIDQVESRHALRHAGWVGRQIPLDNTASGAAFGGDPSVQVVRDSVEPGVTAVACRIPRREHPSAVLSVTGPNFRLEGPDLARACAAVEAAAQAAGHALATDQDAKETARRVVRGQ